VREELSKNATKLNKNIMENIENEELKQP